MEYSNSVIISAINEWIHSERDRRLMIDRLVNGLTYERLAEDYNLSVTQVRRINGRCIAQIVKHL